MYKKDDLRALAIVIGVSDKGTNAELIARIEGHFEQHPDLKHNSRFLGFFNKSIHVAPSQIEEEAQSLWWRAHSRFLVIMKDLHPSIAHNFGSFQPYFNYSIPK